MYTRLLAVSLLLVLIALTGCTRTRLLDASPSAGALHEINEKAERTAATVTLSSGEHASAHQLHLAPDVATWVTEDDGVRSVPLGEVTAVEFESTGRGALEGLGLGVVVGAALGAVLGAATAPSCDADGLGVIYCSGPGLYATAGALAVGAAGGLVGLIVGGTKKSGTVYAVPKEAVDEEPLVASSPAGGARRHLADEEQARILQRLDALQDALRSEPGTEGLQQEVAEAQARAREGHLLRRELPKLVDLFQRYRID